MEAGTGDGSDAQGNDKKGEAHNNIHDTHNDTFHNPAVQTCNTAQQHTDTQLKKRCDQAHADGYTASFSQTGEHIPA